MGKNPVAEASEAGIQLAFFMGDSAAIADLLAYRRQGPASQRDCAISRRTAHD
jgi:hypothetical protein